MKGRTNKQTNKQTNRVIEIDRQADTQLLQSLTIAADKSDFLSLGPACLDVSML